MWILLFELPKLEYAETLFFRFFGIGVWVFRGRAPHSSQQFEQRVSTEWNLHASRQTSDAFCNRREFC